jgi:hypothetical protein
MTDLWESSLSQHGQMQVLRLLLAQKARQTSLRMTELLLRMTEAEGKKGAAG